ncbi:hypothetical protein [Neorickettsia risticii]|nr:hypothetical protein [Neorickettsia risticii]
MKTNKTIFVVCGVVIFLLLLALAVTLYKLYKMRTERDAIRGLYESSQFMRAQRGVSRCVQTEPLASGEPKRVGVDAQIQTSAQCVGVDVQTQTSVCRVTRGVQATVAEPRVPPSLVLGGAQIATPAVPMPGVRGCVLASEGILCAEAGAEEPGWRGSMIILLPGRSIFRTCRYVGAGSSAQVYSALRVYGAVLPPGLSACVRASRVVENPRRFAGPGWSARIVHARSPDMKQHRDSDTPAESILADLLSQLLYESFIKARNMEGTAGATLILPVGWVACADSIEEGEYIRAFASAMLRAAEAVGGDNLAELLGVQQVRICCNNGEIQRALAEEIERQAAASLGSPSC